MVVNLYRRRVAATVIELAKGDPSLVKEMIAHLRAAGEIELDDLVCEPAALREGPLVYELAADEPPTAAANLIHPGHGRLPMKTRASIDFAMGRLRARMLALGIAPPTSDEQTRGR